MIYYHYMRDGYIYEKPPLPHVGTERLCGLNYYYYAMLLEHNKLLLYAFFSSTYIPPTTVQ